MLVVMIYVTWLSCVGNVVGLSQARQRQGPLGVSWREPVDKRPCAPGFVQGAGGTCVPLHVFPRVSGVANTVAPSVAVPTTSLKCLRRAPVTRKVDAADVQVAVQVGSRILTLFLSNATLNEFNINSMKQRTLRTTGTTWEPVRGKNLQGFTAVALASRYAVVVGGCFDTAVTKFPPHPYFVLDVARMAWIQPKVVFAANTPRLQGISLASAVQFSETVFYLIGGSHTLATCMSAKIDVKHTAYRVELKVASVSGEGMVVNVTRIPSSGLPGVGITTPALSTFTTSDGRVGILLYGGSVFNGTESAPPQPTMYIAFPQMGRLDWKEVVTTGKPPSAKYLSASGPPMGVIRSVNGHSLWYSFTNWDSGNTGVRSHYLNMSSREWTTVRSWSTDLDGPFSGSRVQRCVLAPAPFAATTQSCTPPLAGGRSAVVSPQGQTPAYCVVYCLTSEGVPVFVPQTDEWMGQKPSQETELTDTKPSSTAVGSNVVFAGSWHSVALYSTISRTVRHNVSCATPCPLPTPNEEVDIASINNTVYAIGTSSGQLCMSHGIPPGPLPRPSSFSLRWMCPASAALNMDLNGSFVSITSFGRSHLALAVLRPETPSTSQLVIFTLSLDSSAALSWSPLNGTSFDYPQTQPASVELVAVGRTLFLRATAEGPFQYTPLMTFNPSSSRTSHL